MDESVVTEFWHRLGDHVVSPVDFVGNLESLYRDGARLFIELGPGSVLTGFVADTLGDRPHAAVPTMLRHGSEVTQLLKALGVAASRGHLPDLEGLYGPRRPGKTPRQTRPILRPAAPAPEEKAPKPAPRPTATGGEAADLVLGIFSERTGYPRDALGLDLDVEADLGIDSIKQTEIVRAIRVKTGLGKDSFRRPPRSPPHR
jgi:acyl transferase domain-containing protein